MISQTRALKQCTTLIVQNLKVCGLKFRLLLQGDLKKWKESMNSEHQVISQIWQVMISCFGKLKKTTFKDEARDSKEVLYRLKRSHNAQEIQTDSN